MIMKATVAIRFLSLLSSREVMQRKVKTRILRSTIINYAKLYMRIYFS